MKIVPYILQIMEEYAAIVYILILKLEMSLYIL
nr:MAG TPA: hypothetical protein [Bacteriophage sp.]